MESLRAAASAAATETARGKAIVDKGRAMAPANTCMVLALKVPGRSATVDPVRRPDNPARTAVLILRKNLGTLFNATNSHRAGTDSPGRTHSSGETARRHPSSTASALFILQKTL
jgi:hypothetical protein